MVCPITQGDHKKSYYYYYYYGFYNVKALAVVAVAIGNPPVFDRGTDEAPT